MGNCLPFLRSLTSDDTLEQKARRAKRVSFIQQLPMGVHHHGGGGEDSGQECVICVTDLVPGNAIWYLPCTHRFHVDCIDEWLMSGTTCPCCRWLVLVRQPS